MNEIHTHPVYLKLKESLQARKNEGFMIRSGSFGNWDKKYCCALSSLKKDWTYARDFGEVLSISDEDTWQIIYGFDLIEHVLGCDIHSIFYKIGAELRKEFLV